MSNRNDESALMLLVIMVILMVFGMFFGLVQWIANLLYAEMDPVASAVVLTGLFLITAGVVRHFIGGYGGTLFAGSLAMSSFKWWSVLDSMAVCRRYGCQIQKTFFDWLITKTSSSSGPFGSIQMDPPPVWYNSWQFEWALTAALFIATWFIWKSEKNR